MDRSDLPRARGTGSNPKPRFDAQETVPFDDGWPDPDADLAPDPRTTVTVEPAKSIIAHNDSPDIGFNQSINPYRGCEHGCIYCYARPTHAYLGFSPGLDFETRIIARPNAAALLDAELRKPSYRCELLAVGTNTDPYQPAENKLGIMRECLGVMEAFHQPVGITTKGHLVTRDIDILAPMAERRLAAVGVSVTTLERDLCRTMEPRAATPAKRLEAIRLLSQAGIPVTVMVAPIIPFLNDHEMERIMAAAREAGATHAAYTFLRLPLEVKALFSDWLETHHPNKARHVLSLIRQSRDGKLSDSQFGRRMGGQGEFAALVRKRFDLLYKKLGFESHWSLDTSQFRPPPRPGDQLSLL